MSPAEWTALAAGLQFLATVGLVVVTIQYVGAADRQADATEESLRLVTRQERRTAVEELDELRRQVNRYESKMSDLAHREALRKMLDRGHSHPIEDKKVERMRSLAAGLMPLRLKSPPLVLEGVEATKSVMGKWSRTRSEVQSNTGAGERFEALLDLAKQGHEAFEAANRFAIDDLQNLPSRPV